MRKRTTIDTTLHFDLSFVSDSAPVKLHVGTQRIPLQRHTAESLARHRFAAAGCNADALQRHAHLSH